jgi:hypothetical protein
MRSLALAAVILTAAVGCASTGFNQPNEPPPTQVGPRTGAPTAGASDPDPFPVRAGKLAGGWDGSLTEQAWDFGYVPLSRTLDLPADAFHSGADKEAYGAGQFRFAVPLPKAPAQQTIRFDQGTPLTRPGLSPDAALRTESNGRCPTTSCPGSLTVTGASATTLRVRTSRGDATVPAWSFHLAGYQGAFVFAAVKADPFPSSLPGASPGPSLTPRLLGYSGASLEKISADGRTLTLGYVAGCGKGAAKGLVNESKSVVVVGVTDPPPVSVSGACDLVARGATVQVHLSEALGARTVIDVGDGLPLTVTSR